MRNNPGGLLNEAISVSDAFLEKGEIVSTRGRRAENASRAYARPGKDDKDNKGDNKKDEKKNDKKEDKKNDNNKKDNKDNKNEKNKPKPNKISPEQLKNLLKAMDNEERKVQKKVNKNKVKGVPVKNKKDW